MVSDVRDDVPKSFVQYVLYPRRVIASINAKKHLVIGSKDVRKALEKIGGVTAVEVA